MSISSDILYMFRVRFTRYPMKATYLLVTLLCFYDSSF